MSGYNLSGVGDRGQSAFSKRLSTIKSCVAEAVCADGDGAPSTASQDLLKKIACAGQPVLRRIVPSVYIELGTNAVYKAGVCIYLYILLNTLIEHLLSRDWFLVTTRAVAHVAVLCTVRRKRGAIPKVRGAEEKQM